MKINRDFLNMSSNWLMYGVAHEWDLAVVQAIRAGDQFCWLDNRAPGERLSQLVARLPRP